MENDKSFLFWVHSLCFIAGFINLSTLFLYSTATSHLTGNLTRIALELVRGEFQQVLYLVLLPVLFFLGSMVGGAVFSDKVFEPRHSYGIILIILGGLFIALNVITSEPQFLLPCLTFMLGVQNGLFVSYKGMLIRTTHFTGYITDAGFTLGRVLKGRREDLWKLRFCLVSILNFILGGLLASMLFIALKVNVLYLAGLFYILAGLYYAFFLHKRIAA